MSKKYEIQKREKEKVWKVMPFKNIRVTTVDYATVKTVQSMKTHYEEQTRKNYSSTQFRTL